MSFVPSATFPVLPRGYVIRMPGAVIASEPTGLATLTESFRGYFSDIATNQALIIAKDNIAMTRSTESPSAYFPSLLLYSVKITLMTGVLDGKLDVEYRGLDPALSIIPPPIYEIETTTGNEPLQTHPLWVTQMAGTASAPLNNAQFVSYDKTGANYSPAPAGGNPGAYDPTTAVFFQWLAGSIFEGIEDYLAAGMVYKKSWISYDLPSGSQVGQFNSPDGPAPNLPTGYAWFYLGSTSRDDIGIYSNQSTWKAVPTGPAATIIYGGGS